MRNFLIVLLIVGLAACNNKREPSTPSMKDVDSALKAAPDTIKAMPVDSGLRKN